MTRLLSLLLLLVCLAAAGCAETDKRSGDDKFGGFYGGVSSGAEMGP